MTYKFVKQLDGTINFNYTDKNGEKKQKKIVKDVNMISKLSGVNAKAKFNMILDLTKQGMSVENLKIKKVENGKTYIDETNYNILLEEYIQKEQFNIVMEIITTSLGMPLEELFIELGTSENESEMENFMVDFLSAVMGVEKEKMPSKQKNE